MSRSIPAGSTPAWSTTSASQPQAGDFYGGWITADLVGPFKGGAGDARLVTAPARTAVASAPSGSATLMPTPRPFRRPAMSIESSDDPTPVTPTPSTPTCHATGGNPALDRDAELAERELAAEEAAAGGDAEAAARARGLDAERVSEELDRQAEAAIEAMRRGAPD